ERRSSESHGLFPHFPSGESAPKMGTAVQKERPPAQHGCGPRSRGCVKSLVAGAESTPSGSRQIEKMPPCPILNLDDPGIGIEPDFLRKTLFHRLLADGLARERSKDPFDRPTVVVH